MLNAQAGSTGRSAGSLTWAGLLNTRHWIDPARRAASAIMTQVLPFGDERTMRVYEGFEREVYGTLEA